MATVQTFECAICGDLYDDPHSLNCGDVFCRNCISKALVHGSAGSSSTSISCPVCRKEVDGSAISPASMIQQQMMQRSLICNGCASKVPLGHVKAHRTTCSSLVADPVHETETVNWQADAREMAEGIGSSAERSSGGISNRISRYAFCCPYCQRAGFDREGLLTHCLEVHSKDKNQELVCPICAAMPWGNSEQASKDLIGHLVYRHRYEYYRFTDFEMDESEALDLAIRKSLGQ